jgi:hypothetical protein
MVPGVLIQADESVMAVIKKLNTDEQSKYILEELDSESCMVSPEKLPELERKVKEVGFLVSYWGLSILTLLDY